MVKTFTRSPRGMSLLLHRADEGVGNEGGRLPPLALNKGEYTEIARAGRTPEYDPGAASDGTIPNVASGPPGQGWCNMAHDVPTVAQVVARVQVLVKTPAIMERFRAVILRDFLPALCRFKHDNRLWTEMTLTGLPPEPDQEWVDTPKYCTVNGVRRIEWQRVGVVPQSSKGPRPIDPRASPWLAQDYALLAKAHDYECADPTSPDVSGVAILPDQTIRDAQEWKKVTGARTETAGRVIAELSWSWFATAGSLAHRRPPLAVTPARLAAALAAAEQDLKELGFLSKSVPGWQRWSSAYAALDRITGELRQAAPDTAALVACCQDLFGAVGHSPFAHVPADALDGGGPMTTAAADFAGRLGRLREGIKADCRAGRFSGEVTERRREAEYARDWIAANLKPVFGKWIDEDSPPNASGSGKPHDDGGEYRPASWFTKGASGWLRTASSPERKSKRVRKRIEGDSTRLYCVADVAKYKPELLRNDARGRA